MVGRRGLRETLRIPWRELRFRLRHRALHRRTTLGDGRGVRGDGHRDEAARIAIVEHALSMIPAWAHDGAFADVGCSRGRVLQVATGYPYRRILGVELSPELAAAAQANVRDPRIEIVTADAGDWSVPDDVTAVYLFNPFGAQTTARFLAALVASQERVRRPVALCEVSGVHPDLVREAGFVQTADAPYVSIWTRGEISPSAPGS